jgi:hypothetical protein
MNIARWLCLYTGLVLLGGCASGSSIAVGAAHPPIRASQVQLFVDPPGAYETVGLVKAESGVGMSDQDSINYALAELKAQAAKLGANGVLLTSQGVRSMGESISRDKKGRITSSLPMNAQTLEGKAIVVK